MTRTWRIAVTVFGLVAVSAMPFLAMADPPARVVRILFPALSVACFAASAAAGFWSRPRWLALGVVMAAIAVSASVLLLTSAPCHQEFCEGFTPQGMAFVAGAYLVWPWQLLGVVAGGLAAHVVGRAREQREAGAARPMVREVLTLGLYLAAGLALAWFVLGAMQ